MKTTDGRNNIKLDRAGVRVCIIEKKLDKGIALPKTLFIDEGGESKGTEGYAANNEITQGKWSRVHQKGGSKEGVKGRFWRRGIELNRSASTEYERLQKS